MGDKTISHIIPYDPLAEATESVLVAIARIVDAEGRRVLVRVDPELAFAEVRMLVERLAKSGPMLISGMPKPLAISEGDLADLLRATGSHLA